jgi:hypothetical protein
MSAPLAGRYALDLRIDIDQRHANSPVLNRVSADRFEVNSFRLPGRPTWEWRVYQESWVCDAPIIDWQPCQVVITGAVRYWQGAHPVTTMEITVPWGALTMGPARVILREAGGAESSFSCSRTSDSFRAVAMEIDVCNSVNRAPILPSYSTDAHNTRPTDLPVRTITIEEAYREAGIEVTISPTVDVIDDSAPGFATWSPAELHDAMEQHFSAYGGVWPKWQLWGVLAGTYDNSAVGGLMFDAAGTYGGAGKAPERQGFAVFRNHQWFNTLPAGVPADQGEAEALRKYLYTWVHEAGHAYNLLHSWNKSRPDSLSWMNYDWRYDQRNGVDSFWSNFRMRFDDEELIHIRHGDRASVMMGGDAWATGAHLEGPPGATTQTEGQAPLELLIRSKEYFEFMEPVSVELRVRNLLPDIPIQIDARLAPEFGTVLVHIRRPDGRTVEYAPIIWHLGDPVPMLLAPASAQPGTERFSQEVALTYGGFGFHFDQPGQYLVRATYQGAGDLVITSNVHRLRIGAPTTKDEDRLGQEFFSYETGMALYVGDARSPFLAKGEATLTEITQRFGDTLVGAKVASALSMSEAEPFYRLGTEHRLERAREPDPAKALALSQQAVAVYRRNPEKALNLGYRRAVDHHARLLVEAGQPDQARAEVATMAEDLAKRGVHPPVIEGIKASAPTDQEPQTRKRTATRTERPRTQNA